MAKKCISDIVYAAYVDRISRGTVSDRIKVIKFIQIRVQIAVLLQPSRQVIINLSILYMCLYARGRFE